MKVLVINPGATSTKVAVFDEETQVYKTTVDHSPQELDRFDRVIDQADFRQQAILEANAADLEAAMRDRFGQDTLFLPEADGYFHFDVPVCVSDQFYGWVCGFGGKVEVTSPAEVRQGLHDMVQELAEQHN